MHPAFTGSLTSISLRGQAIPGAEDRQKLIPGLGEVLAMPQMPGLLGLALSGAGPSIVALATAGFDEIGKAIAARFDQAGVASTMRFLEVAQDGLSILENRPRRN